MKCSNLEIRNSTKPPSKPLYFFYFVILIIREKPNEALSSKFKILWISLRLIPTYSHAAPLSRAHHLRHDSNDSNDPVPPATTNPPPPTMIHAPCHHPTPPPPPMTMTMTPPMTMIPAPPPPPPPPSMTNTTHAPIHPPLLTTATPPLSKSCATVPRSLEIVELFIGFIFIF